MAMTRTRTIVVGVVAIAIVVVLVIWANQQRRNDPPPSDPTPRADTRTVVPWGDYDPTVQQRIDELQAAKDCRGLQAEFDTADANSSATLDRTGHGNGDLMAYIDEALELAGCY